MAKSKFWSEFKDFAMKGNVIDMAIGIVIGGAFGKIVTSLVNDLLMPCIGALIGGFDFTNLKVVLSKAVMDGDTVVKPAVAVTWGNFLQVIFDFLIIALCIFLMIKAMNKLMPKKEEPEAPAGPTQEELLADIRDLLKEKK